MKDALKILGFFFCFVLFCFFVCYKKSTAIFSQIQSDTFRKQPQSLTQPLQITSSVFKPVHSSNSLIIMTFHSNSRTSFCQVSEQTSGGSRTLPKALLSISEIMWVFLVFTLCHSGNGTYIYLFPESIAKVCNTLQDQIKS